MTYSHRIPVQDVCERARAAAMKGNMEVLRHIFQEDFTVVKLDSQGNTVLHLTAQHGQDAALKYVLTMQYIILCVITVSKNNWTGDTGINCAF